MHLPEGPSPPTPILIPLTPRARELMLDVARRQSRREQSWFRMTGFPFDVDGDIATVLAS